MKNILQNVQFCISFSGRLIDRIPQIINYIDCVCFLSEFEFGRVFQYDASQLCAILELKERKLYSKVNLILKRFQNTWIKFEARNEMQENSSFFMSYSRDRSNKSNMFLTLIRLINSAAHFLFKPGNKYMSEKTIISAKTLSDNLN